MVKCTRSCRNFVLLVAERRTKASSSMVSAGSLEESHLHPLTQSQASFCRVLHGNTLNHKDVTGLYMWVLCAVIFLLTFLNAGVAASFACVFGIAVVRRPIYVLYMGSVLFALTMRTAEVLDQYYHFPQCGLFEDPVTFEQVQREVLDFVGTHAMKKIQDTYGTENAAMGCNTSCNGKAWRIKPVVVLGKVASGIETCMPTLVRLLKTCNASVNYCLVSVLEPGACIPMHVGYFKGALRYMLGVRVPKNVCGTWLNINGKKLSWVEGAGLLFDDTYPHAVYNTTNEPHITLFMDVNRQRDVPWGLAYICRILLRLAKWSGIANAEMEAAPLKDCNV